MSYPRLSQLLLLSNYLHLLATSVSDPQIWRLRSDEISQGHRQSSRSIISLLHTSGVTPAEGDGVTFHQICFAKILDLLLFGKLLLLSMDVQLDIESYFSLLPLGSHIQCDININRKLLMYILLPTVINAPPPLSNICYIFLSMGNLILYVLQEG